MESGLRFLGRFVRCSFVGTNIETGNRHRDGAERQVIVADDDLTGQNLELKPAKATAGQEWHRSCGGWDSVVVEVGH
jgi:hypothetical protein